MIEGVLDGMHEAHAALVLRDAHSTPRFWCLQTWFNGPATMVAHHNHS